VRPRAVGKWVAIAMTLVACSKPETKKEAVARPVSSAAETSSAAPLTPTVAPRDLDIAALERDLKCGKSSRSEACRILKEFSKGQRFAAKTPSGGGRWIGPAVTVDKGTETARHLVLWAKTVPLSQVGAGDLPIKAAYELIPEGLKLQSEKLMRALVKSSDPPESNPAYKFAHAFEPTKTYVLANTEGPSVHLTAEQSVYLRFAPPRKVYLVNPAPSGAPAGDGMYAELWLGDW